MRMLCSATQGNSSPEEHATYVWKHIVEDCAAREIYVVAHSYGGVVTTHLVGLSLSFCITITLYYVCVVCVTGRGPRSLQRACEKDCLY